MSQQSNKRLLTPQQQKINGDPAYWDHFDKYWEQDFSWEELSKHKIENYPDGHSLQDYWREEESNLIEFAGKKWTRFHLPTHDQAGDTSEKFDLQESDWQAAKWQDWHEVILQKLGAATKSGWNRPDGRAQFQGVCFPNDFYLSSDPAENESKQQKHDRTLHLIADWARFGQFTRFDNTSFGDHTRFHNASFSDYAEFNNASFGDYAEFNNANFNDAQFYNGNFGDGANFNNVRFGDYTQFSNVSFNDYAHFNNTSFGDYAEFNNASFGDYTEFSNANFGKHARFDNASFGKVSFRDTKFDAWLRFYGTKFLSLAEFHGCTFHQDTSFAEAEFSVPNESDSELAEQYQNAFQSLRLRMENIRNHAQERKFSKLEMQAREMRSGSKDVPTWVRLLSKAYGLLADYGQSAVRPLIGIIALFLTASGAYWLIAGDDANWSGAIGTAFQSSLPPVSFAITQFYESNADLIFLNALYQHPALTRLVMTLHGLSSLALLFFLLLALKHRFQIR